MSLTFKGLTKPQECLIAGIFPVPKYGSVTVNELDAYSKADHDLAKKVEEGAISASEAQNQLAYITATAMMKSRVDPEWTIEDTRQDFWSVLVDGEECQQISLPLISGLSNFFAEEFREMRGMDKSEEEESNGKGKQSRGRKSTGS